MHRHHTLIQLEKYEEFWYKTLYHRFPATPIKENLLTLRQMRQFLENTPEAFDRSLSIGHFTGSIFILSHNWQKCLLMQHRKLKKWLQLGGHADGCSHLEEVALKEGREESGLNDLKLFPISSHSIIQWAKTEESPHLIPFDIDIHEIPARAQEAAHLHYDVRFLATTEKPESIILDTSEGEDLRWCSYEQASQLTHEPSMFRLFQKWAKLREMVNPS